MKLKIENATVKYSRTRQVNQYEPETVEVTADIFMSDMSLQDAIKELKFEVHKAMGLTKAATSGVKEKVEDIPVIEKPKKKVTKKKVTKKESKPVEPIVIYKLEQVLDSMKGLAKARGISVAKDILKDLGYPKTKDVPEELYPKLMAEVEKCLK